MTGVELPDIEATNDLLAQLRATSSDFENLVARLGHAALAFRHIGLVQWQADRLDEASEAFLAALSLAPENPDLWRDLAGVYSAANLPEIAESSIRTSLVLDARNAQSWLLLAGLLDRREDTANAEDAYGRAIGFEPTLAAAHFGLGLLLFKRKLFTQALESLRNCVEHDPTNGLAQSCLGHLFYIAYDFAASAQAFDAATRTMPLDRESNRKRARALTFQAMIDGNIRQALLDYAHLAGPDEEDLDTISSDAFSIFSASGQLEAAIAIGQIRLAQKPDDPIRRYLLDAVRGTTMRSAPTDYIERYFDHFAPRFDQKLVETLGYAAPSLMTDLIIRHRTRFTRMLDLGCGTGLAADRLAQFGTTLIGVDLSSGMLAEAEKRERYSELVKSEIIAYLDRSTASFDLIFAADVLIYFGDLVPIVGAVSNAMVTGGVFVLTLEAGKKADFALLPSGRFSHNAEYLKQVAAPYFTILEFVDDSIRLEAGIPVSGHYVVLERR